MYVRICTYSCVYTWPYMCMHVKNICEFCCVWNTSTNTLQSKNTSSCENANGTHIFSRPTVRLQLAPLDQEQCATVFRNNLGHQISAVSIPEID